MAAFPLTAEECVLCGTIKKVLHLYGTESHEETNRLNNPSTWMTQLTKTLDGVTDMLKKQLASVLDGSGFNDIGTLVQYMDKRYEHQVLANDIPLGVVREWILTPNRKFKRKFLVAFKQGLVCNRCDQRFNYDQLTLDEVIPKSRGGKATLANSQLLCLSCQRAKDDQLPDTRDISAFRYTGPPCVHFINCSELL